MALTPARARLDACLTRISNPSGEGQRAFTRLYPEEARIAAAAADARAKFGRTLGPLDGRIVSMLEGGYNLPALARSVELHVRALIGID